MPPAIVFQALIVTIRLKRVPEFGLDVDDAGPEQRKLCKAVGEFGGYLRANAASIPNYSERDRVGEVISSSLAESTINQVVSKRMVKKQQMRWTPRGAHLLLQVRTRVCAQRRPRRRLPPLALRLHPHHRRLASRARRCRVTSHGEGPGGPDSRGSAGPAGAPASFGAYPTSGSG